MKKMAIITLMTLFSLSANAQMGFAAGYLLGSGSSDGGTTSIAVPVSTTPCMIKVPKVPEYLDDKEFIYITINSSMIAYISKFELDVEKKRPKSRWDGSSDKIKYTASRLVLADGTTFFINKRLADLESLLSQCSKVVGQ